MYNTHTTKKSKKIVAKLFSSCSDMTTIIQESVSLLLILSFLSLFLHQSYLSTAVSLKDCRFDSIYQFGDSISDTGNKIRESPNFACSRVPYGETSFNKPTGRCCNGLLMIDYFAMEAGIPFLDAYLNKDARSNRDRGMNFAVAGSTALSPNVLAQKNISFLATNSSLSRQLNWMLTHFNSMCPYPKDCAKKLKQSLFMVGEIGINDYNYALFGGKSIKVAMELVPEVVQAIKHAVQKVISYGAVRVIVPGAIPLGCIPLFLTYFKSNISSAYDKHHCLKELNNLAVYHNNHLIQAIEDLKKKHPNVNILYGDYYNAFQWIYNNAAGLGFDVANVQKACCGSRLFRKSCGDNGVKVCSRPDRYISWDGIHLTQKAYQYMSSWLVRDILRKLHCPV